MTVLGFHLPCRDVDLGAKAEATEAELKNIPVKVNRISVEPKLQNV